MIEEKVVTELIDAIVALKNHLGPNGEFSICKSDGGKINLFEAMLLGSVMDQIDKAVEQLRPMAVERERIEW